MLELDLNVDATFSKEPVTDAITVVYMEDCSPTSSSSVIVNTVSGATEEDSDSTATYTAQPTSFFAFDILNKPQEHSFQLTGAGKTITGDEPSEPGSGRFSSAQAQPHWLNLSYAEPLVEKAPSELSVMQQKQQLPPVTAKKSRRGPRSRSSQYRGVTFYRRTGRWESHIWDCGKQVYLGGFDTAHAAARAYDRAAIKFRGVDADINFNLSDYEEDMKQTKNLGKEEFVHVLRRQSTGFARGSSKYRAVTLQKCGRLEARMGQLLGKNAYDAATVRCNEIGVLTDFKPAAHDRGLTWGANNQGSVHNLDLSIGISSSSVDSKNNDNRGNINFACAAIEMPKREMPLLASAPSAPVYGQLTSHGLAMASRNISVWPAILPSSYVPKHEDGGRKDRIVEAISLPKFPNWAWQMQQGHGHGSIFSTAASSGFSSSVPPSSVSSTALPLHNRHTASHYYSHME